MIEWQIQKIGDQTRKQQKQTTRKRMQTSPLNPNSSSQPLALERESTGPAEELGQQEGDVTERRVVAHQQQVRQRGIQARRILGKLQWSTMGDEGRRGTGKGKRLGYGEETNKERNKRKGRMEKHMTRWKSKNKPNEQQQQQPPQKCKTSTTHTRPSS